MILSFRDASPSARTTVSVTGGAMRKINRTSQRSRVTERLLTRELSGGKVSADSSTRLVADLVVEYVDFRFDSFSSVVLDLTACSEDSGRSGRLSCSVPVTDCVGSRAALSGLRRKVVR